MGRGWFVFSLYFTPWQALNRVSVLALEKNALILREAGLFHDT
jgi:hypothetical protein